MNKEKFKNIIKTALSDKKLSRTKLSRLTSICNTTLNDLINGSIKK